jgi:hypothetical protein
MKSLPACEFKVNRTTYAVGIVRGSAAKSQASRAQVRLSDQDLLADHPVRKILDERFRKLQKRSFEVKPDSERWLRATRVGIESFAEHVAILEVLGDLPFRVREFRDF